MPTGWPADERGPAIRAPAGGSARRPRHPPKQTAVEPTAARASAETLTSSRRPSLLHRPSSRRPSSRPQPARQRPWSRRRPWRRRPWRRSRPCLPRPSLHRSPSWQRLPRRWWRPWRQPKPRSPHPWPPLPPNQRPWKPIPSPCRRLAAPAVMTMQQLLPAKGVRPHVLCSATSARAIIADCRSRVVKRLRQTDHFIANSGRER